MKLQMIRRISGGSAASEVVLSEPCCLAPESIVPPVPNANYACTAMSCKWRVQGALM
jgi:hypothetical protein